MTLVTVLDRIAGEIRVEVDAAERDYQSAMGHALRAGELLLEAKGRVGHGRWLPWLAENFPADKRTAQTYMRLAANAQRVSHLPTVREAVALLSESGSGAAGSATVADLPAQVSLLDDDVSDDEAVELASAELERLEAKFGGELGDGPPPVVSNGASAPVPASASESEPWRDDVRLLAADLRRFAASGDVRVARRALGRWRAVYRVLDEAGRVVA